MDLGAIGVSKIELHKVNATLDPDMAIGPERNSVRAYTLDPKMAVGQEHLINGNHDALTADMRESAAALSAAIDRAEWDPKIPVYRGITVEDEAATVARFESNVGKAVQLDGFQSASLLPTEAGRFSDQSSSGRGLIFEISTSKALNVAPISVHPDEREVLLGHGWEYRVQSVEHDVGIAGRELKRTVVRLVVTKTPKFEE